MFLDDPVHDGQAEAGAVILGGKKRIEDVGDIFTANAFAVIANGDAQNLVHFPVGSASTAAIHSSAVRI